MAPRKVATKHTDSNAETSAVSLSESLKADLAERFGCLPTEVEDRIKDMSLESALNEYLCWHGIIGWTGSILHTISELEKFGLK